jgi:hypothetical protein
MNKLLIYIGENVKFEVESTINAIVSMSKVVNVRRGNFTGAIFECEYKAKEFNVIVRLTSDAETIVVDGLWDESLEFSLELQKRLTVALYAIDMGYNFAVALQDFGSVEDFRKAISF